MLARRWGVVLLVGLLACGAQPGDPDTLDAGGDTVAVDIADDLSASLDVITEQVEVALRGAAFALGQAGQALSVGDQIRTDDIGFAEVTYHDGSWQRVDSGATLTIVALLADGAAQAVTTSVDLGRSWNNVRALTGPRDAYELETPVATASVRGTIFATACPAADVCTFTAVEGTIVISPVEGEPFELTAPAQVTIRAGGDLEQPQILLSEDLLADPWVARNLELDGTEIASDNNLDAAPPGDEWVLPVACTLLTDEQVVAALGEPVAPVTVDDTSDWFCRWYDSGGPSGTSQRRLDLEVSQWVPGEFLDARWDSFVSDVCSLEIMTAFGDDGRVLRCTAFNNDPRLLSVAVAVVQGEYEITLTGSILDEDVSVLDEAAVLRAAQQVMAALDGGMTAIG